MRLCYRNCSLTRNRCTNRPPGNGKYDAIRSVLIESSLLFFFLSFFLSSIYIYTLQIAVPLLEPRDLERGFQSSRTISGGGEKRDGAGKKEEKQFAILKFCICRTLLVVVVRAEFKF